MVNNEMKILGRKFLVTLLVMTAAFILKFLNRLGDWQFVALFGGAFIIWELIEGTLDLKALGSIKIKDVQIYKKGGEDE